MSANLPDYSHKHDPPAKLYKGRVQHPHFSIDLFIEGWGQTDLNHSPNRPIKVDSTFRTVLLFLGSLKSSLLAILLNFYIFCVKFLCINLIRVSRRIFHQKIAWCLQMSTLSSGIQRSRFQKEDFLTWKIPFLVDEPCPVTRRDYLFVWSTPSVQAVILLFTQKHTSWDPGHPQPYHTFCV